MNQDNVIILVEFDEPGIKKVSRVEELTESAVEQSKEAIKNALKTVAWVAEKAKDTLDNTHHRPDEAELEFGIKVGSKAGYLVAQADAEFHIKAKLIWRKPTVNESEYNASS